MEQHLPNASNECATCGATLQGKFCQDCGEKKLNPEHDFSVRHFLEETFESFTHLDSRVLRSFWLLFSRPGFLTAEFIAGRRVRYLKPIPFFIIAGVLFYLFFGKATAFFSNLGDMSQAYKQNNWVANTFHVDTESIFLQKASAAQQEPEVYWKKMAEDASHRSKTWLFLIVPVWGMMLWLLFFRKIKWFAPHLIFALHGLTFFVLFDLLMLFISNKLLGFSQLGDKYVLFLAICFAIYIIKAAQRVYGLRRFTAAMGGLSALFLFLIVLMLYRQTITIWTLMVY